MQELNVNPDVDTYSTYVLPTFPSVDGARVALKVMACAYVSVLGMQPNGDTWNEKDNVLNVSANKSTCRM